MRSVASDTLAVNGMQHYAAYGDPFGAQGSLGTPFGFTGEQTDGNGLVYLRARHYAPSVGIFPSLDPFEGIPGRPMSLNGYTYVEGNVVNATDANGMSRELAQLMSSGGCSDAEDCRNKCKDTVNPLTCTLVCLDEQREIQEQNIKNATVMIGLGDAEDQATCQSGRWIVSPNLGTITSRGIITHDHVAGAGAFFGRTAHDTNEAVTFFKSWPCVHFTGRSGTISLPGWAIRIEGGQSVQGTLLISPYQSYGILGHPSGSKTFSEV